MSYEIKHCNKVESVGINYSVMKNNKSNKITGQYLFIYARKAEIEFA